MTRYGLLTKDRFAPVVPVHAPAYLPAPTVDFSDVDVLSITYRTDFDIAAQIVPDALELDDEPQVTLSFVSYGVSGAGPYREMFQSIACRHQGRPVGYVPHIFVTNEPSMLAGREWLGWPKMLADISFSTETEAMDGLITARLERPAGVELAASQFVPTRRLDDEMTPAGVDTVTMNLRVIPSAVPGEPPTTMELVPSTMTVMPGEIWTGRGNVRLTGASEFVPLHRMPVLETTSAMLIRKARMRLTAPSQTYPL